MKKNQPIIYSLLIVSGILIGTYIGDSPSEKSENTKLNGVLQLIESHYVDTLKTNFEDEVISSILKELDPHSTYIPKKEFQSVSENMAGSFSGIGVQFNIIEDSIVVVAAISGGPSEKLGIQSGDRIVEVAGKDVASINIKNEGVIKRLRGEKGTTVEIKILRRGNNSLLNFAIVRDDIPLYSVDASIMLSKDIGYIKVNRFSATTFDEFTKGANKLLSSGMQKLILDLRGNPGGYLGAAASICDEFLKENKLIVYTEGRNREKQEILATINGAMHHTEVIVLINEGSASASEIVAGALQDNDRGTIIGRQSFGKGLVQEEIHLNDGSAVHITTQRYYTPSGRCIQKPYGKNNKEYYLERYNRDSKKPFLDSLKFETAIGRTVYGGGGIAPDIIIKRDSTLNYSKINFMIAKGWVNTFAITYADKNRTKWKGNSILFIEDVSLHFAVYDAFKSYAKRKDADIDFKMGNTEKVYFMNLLKANVARNIWDNEAYNKILIQEDEFVTEAIISF